MTTIKDLQAKTVKFRDKRDWKKFHNPKDSAIALVFEAVELLEHFRWMNKKETQQYTRKNKKALGDELADILSWVLLMGHDLDIDLVKAFHQKNKDNEKKYPVEQARGSIAKYTQYK